MIISQKPPIWIFAVGMVLLLGTASSASASVIEYATYGLVGTSGVTGTNAIRFDPIGDGSVSYFSSLSLGSFVVSPLPSGQITTYNHTPFAITLAIETVDGQAAQGPIPTITLTGFLNGQISGSNQANVTATFDPIAEQSLHLTSFGSEGYYAFGSLFYQTLQLSLFDHSRSLVPASSADGRTSLEAFLSAGPVPIPEPSTMAFFAALGVAALMRKRMLRRS